MSGIRALIFDMDGVIIDSNPLHRIAWTEYMRRHGIEMTDVMQQQMYGKRNDELIREFFGSHLTAGEVFAHGAAKEALYREMMGPRAEESLVPGVRGFLGRHRGLQFGLATNAEPPNVDFVLDTTGLRSLFAVVVNGHQVTHPKPHPEIYLRVAEMLGVPPAECVVFEDSYTGVEAGVAAGMPVVGLTTTHHDLPGVALLIPDFRDLTLESWLSAQGVETAVSSKK
jgi:beta-phosphoglucomutase family hydrolase